MSIRPEMQKIIIIGGGIAGLSAAYCAVRAKHASPLQVTLLEAGSHWGGKITTDRVPFDDGDFIIEGGPDTILATKPWGVALCKELGLGDRLHGTNQSQKNTYVLHRNKLQPLPDGLAMMIPTNISSILKSQLVSWSGKVRMGVDFLLPNQNGHHASSRARWVGDRPGSGRVGRGGGRRPAPAVGYLIPTWPRAPWPPADARRTASRTRKTDAETGGGCCRLRIKAGVIRAA